jgi:hypothetical protein
MATELDVAIGSGTLPHVGPLYPPISASFPEGRYPVVGGSELRSIRGSASVILNPEDFSIHVGLRQQAVAVSTSAVALPAVPYPYRRALVIHNAGPGTLYIGSSNVSTANGFPLALNEKIAVDIQGHDGVTIYGVSDSSVDARIIEFA